MKASKLADGTCLNSCEHNKDKHPDTILQLQRLTVENARNGSESSANTLWDAGSTLCFITFDMARKLKLQGELIKLDIVTVGGESKEVDSQRFKVSIKDVRGESVAIEVLGIEQISTEIEGIEIKNVLNKFSNSKAELIDRPVDGHIDMLIGFQYAAYHPEGLEAVNHLLLMQNRFGVLLAGSHPDLSEKTKTVVKHAKVLHVYAKEEEFYTTESLGVACTPPMWSLQVRKLSAWWEKYDNTRRKGTKTD